MFPGTQPIIFSDVDVKPKVEPVEMLDEPPTQLPALENVSDYSFEVDTAFSDIDSMPQGEETDALTKTENVESSAENDLDGDGRNVGTQRRETPKNDSSTDPERREESKGPNSRDKIQNSQFLNRASGELKGSKTPPWLKRRTKKRNVTTNYTGNSKAAKLDKKDSPLEAVSAVAYLPSEAEQSSDHPRDTAVVMGDDPEKTAVNDVEKNFGDNNKAKQNAEESVDTSLEEGDSCPKHHRTDLNASSGDPSVPSGRNPGLNMSHGPSQDFRYQGEEETTTACPEGNGASESCARAGTASPGEHSQSHPPENCSPVSDEELHELLERPLSQEKKDEDSPPRKIRRIARVEAWKRIVQEVCAEFTSTPLPAGETGTQLMSHSPDNLAEPLPELQPKQTRMLSAEASSGDFPGQSRTGSSLQHEVNAESPELQNPVSEEPRLTEARQNVTGGGTSSSSESRTQELPNRRPVLTASQLYAYNNEACYLYRTLLCIVHELEKARSVPDDFDLCLERIMNPACFVCDAKNCWWGDWEGKIKPPSSSQTDFFAWNEVTCFPALER